MEILQAGFETAVRSRFGLDEDDLPNEEINQPLIVDVAEALIKRRVPRYTEITDDIEFLFLQNAVISQICAILCPSMPRRLDLKVAVSDVKIEKEKVDWIKQQEIYLQEVESNLSQITSVEVLTSAGTPIVGLIRNERKPIGRG